MALERKDSVADTSTTTGTGTLTLLGAAPAGRLTFAGSSLTTGAKVRYRIALPDETEWEVGEGIWTASGATLTRATVFASSNSGSLVNFSAGTKDVSLVLTAADLSTPVFRAHRTSNQSLTASTTEKVLMNTVEFDTASAFDTTNNRYTADLAGFYSITGQVCATAQLSNLFARLYKNGTLLCSGADSSSSQRSIVSDIVFLDVGDYVELWVYSSGGTLEATTSKDTFLAGALVAAQ